MTERSGRIIEDSLVLPNASATVFVIGDHIIQ